jgi:predicted metal-dependent peptidase
MSITRDEKGNDTNKENKEWNLDQYPDVADWSNFKKKDLIDLLEGDVFGLYGLLSVCDVKILEDDPEIKTACLTLTATPKIFINRKFLNKFCPTSHYLFILLMHEMYHKILNHAAVFKKAEGVDKALANLATDAFINALLFQLYPEDKYAGFFRDFYNQLTKEKQDEDPTFTGHPYTFLKSRSSISDYRQRMFYQQLYSPYGQDLDSIFKILRETTPVQYVQQCGESGMGDHSGEGGEIHDHLRKEISKIVKKAHKSLQDKAKRHKEMEEARKKAEEEAKRKKEEKEGNRKGKEKKKDTHYADQNVDEMEKTQSWDPNSTAFCKYIGGVIEALDQKDKSLTSSMIKMSTRSVKSKVAVSVKKMFPVVPFQTVKPNYKKKSAIICHYLNKYKPFHENPVKPVDYGACHVYVDVSGSMGRYVDEIYSILCNRSICDLLHEKIHLFSTKIEDITKKELKARVIDTSFGTDFDCIFEHMLKNDVRRALIFTDGYANEVNKDLQDKMKQKKIQIIGVFTPDRQDNNPIWKLAKENYTFQEDMSVAKDDAVKASLDF